MRRQAPVRIIRKKPATISLAGGWFLIKRKICFIGSPLIFNDMSLLYEEKVEGTRDSGKI